MTSRALLPTLVLLLGLSSSARAQSADPAAAMELFRQGRDAMKAGDFATACPRFAESLRLDEKVGTALNLAECEEHQGQLASARAHAQRAIDLALAGHDDRLALAQERFAALDRRVPRLTVTLAPGAPPDALVRRDTVPLGPGSLGSALPVDPGAHVVVVSAPGFESKTFPVQLVEGQTSQLEVTPGAPLPQPAPEPPPAPRPAPVPPPPEPVGPTGSGMRTWGWIAGGVGVAGAAAGSVLGLMAISKNNQSKQTCDAENVCDQGGKDERDTARALGDASTVAFVVGGAGIATSIVLLLTSPSQKRTTGVTVTPLVGAGAAGVGLGGRW
jgi:hypothetical protein